MVCTKAPHSLNYDNNSNSSKSCFLNCSNTYSIFNNDVSESNPPVANKGASPLLGRFTCLMWLQLHWTRFLISPTHLSSPNSNASRKPSWKLNLLRCSTKLVWTHLTSHLLPTQNHLHLLKLTPSSPTFTSDSTCSKISYNNFLVARRNLPIQLLLQELPAQNGKIPVILHLFKLTSTKVALL